MPQKSRATNPGPPDLRVGLVVPHIFMQQKLLPQVIFSPGVLALDLADGLQKRGVSVSLFSPGPVATIARNVTADLSLFEAELAGRGYGYLELLKKHPLTFVTLARQLQAELIAKAFTMANEEELDIVHIYTNEEDIALPFSPFCLKPVVFTHHDPFNFLIGYKNNFPKYKDRNWIALSESQKFGMPKGTNWVATIYHGLPEELFKPNFDSGSRSLLYIGRIIEPKGLHLAIAAVQRYNASHKDGYVLKVAGKHYGGYRKDAYWQEQIEPQIDGQEICYVGFADTSTKEALMREAAAVMMPGAYAEPFGMVAVESLACGTPVVCLDSGALPEIIQDGITGTIVKKSYLADNTLDNEETISRLAGALERVPSLNRKTCHDDFLRRFTVARMCSEHETVYRRLASL